MFLIVGDHLNTLGSMCPAIQNTIELIALEYISALGVYGLQC